MTLGFISVAFLGQVAKPCYFQPPFPTPQRSHFKIHICIDASMDTYYGLLRKRADLSFRVIFKSPNKKLHQQFPCRPLYLWARTWILNLFFPLRLANGPWHLPPTSKAILFP